MPPHRSIVFAPLVLVLAGGPALSAETLRNPIGTIAPPTTMRNPSGTEGAPRAPGERSDPAVPATDTRPARGTDADGSPDRGAFATSGPVPVRPGDYANGTVAGGIGAPSVLNPTGAHAGTTPAPTSGSRPNGGVEDAGSKPAPMQADGVRKVE